LRKDKETNALKEELKFLKALSQERDLQEEIEKKISQLEKEIEKKEVGVFLSGKYDKGNAILSVYAGAGGQDAQDWAAMLLRMYERYCHRKGLKTKILHRSFGEGGGPEGRIGIKSATLEIRGPYAFGFLKKESGVHRLVRISPFSAKKLRHTSFARVEVLPEIKTDKEIELNPQDLEIETFRASGPGGQYVNKRETAVRVTHLPSGLRAQCQSERLQGENKKRALEILRAKLYQLKEQEREEKLKKLRGEKMEASWGRQIRSYVLHPYKMVKDLRTKTRDPNPERVLDGRLDSFIESEIKMS